MGSCYLVLNARTVWPAWASSSIILEMLCGMLVTEGVNRPLFPLSHCTPPCLSPQPTLAAGGIGSGFCSSRGTASPWTESSVHLGLAFFPDSLLPPRVAATGSYVLALDECLRGPQDFGASSVCSASSKWTSSSQSRGLQRRAPASWVQPWPL